MGNSNSNVNSNRDRSIDQVDGGYVQPPPNSVYSNERQDWDKDVVRNLIVNRKLAPFYKGLNDFNNDMSDLEILNQKYDGQLPSQVSSPTTSPSQQVRTPRRSTSSSSNNPRSTVKPSINFEAFVYRDSQECPICFLFYPPNQNKSRCCDQPLCTDCFVQIKRAEPTTTHLESEPAACPYCAQENFGVTYCPPQWRTGVGAGTPPIDVNPESLSYTKIQNQRTRRKSISADNPDVVLIDTIRPDWKAKLDAVRAQAARRANRRIIMRQVGDRLVPVGVTSSRHPLANSQLPPGLFLSSEGGVQQNQQQQQPAQRTRSSRSGRRAVDNLVNSLGTGADLEEVMIMEAMRLSLLEEEERNRRVAEEERNERQAIERSSSQTQSNDDQLANIDTQTQTQSNIQSTQAETQLQQPPTAHTTHDNNIPSMITTDTNNTNELQSVSSTHNRRDSEHSSLNEPNVQQSRLSEDSTCRIGLLATDVNNNNGSTKDENDNQSTIESESIVRQTSEMGTTLNNAHNNVQIQ